MWYLLELPLRNDLVMKIKIILFAHDRKTNAYESERYEFTGDWALETMIEKLLEKFYGTKISSKVMSYLRERRI